MKIISALYLILGLSTLASASIEVHGHRGTRALRPENTLPAFGYALNVGVDVLELDMDVTKDGVIVIGHDPIINPDICTDENGNDIGKNKIIHQMTLAEVKKLDCGSKKNPRFPLQLPVPGTKMPTLEELFAFVKNFKAPIAKTVRFNIETKSDPKHPELAPEPKDFAALVIKIVKKHGLLNRVILQSFDHRTLVEAKKIEPKIIIAALTDSEDTGTDYPKILGALKPEIFSPNMGEISVKDVVAAHKANIKVVPWTANKPAEWDQLIAAGVDGIISDDPEALIKYLKEKKLR